MIVYLFEYNPCTYESAASTLSVHKTEEGAYKALEEHQEKKREEYQNKIEWELKEYPGLLKSARTYHPDKFGESEWWGVTEVKLLP